MDNSDTVDSLIVRNIGDIESALAHAEKIGNDLWEAIESTLRDRLEAKGWHVSDFDEHNDRIWFAPRDWMARDTEQPDADPSFSIEVFSGLGGMYEKTHLAEFLQAGPNGAGIALWFFSKNLEKKRYRRRIVDGDRPELAVLRAAGFEVDSEHWIRRPIKFEVEAVAQGSTDDDFSDALKPLLNAVEAAVENVNRFSALINCEPVT